jgi:AbrB family looped-hinge helix DNA binding protein
MGRITTLTRKGQITIPKDVREELGLKPSDQVEIWTENGEARLRKARRLNLRDIAGSIPAPAIPLEEAIARAKAERAEVRARTVLQELSSRQ